jgi:hypothetical protein
MSQWPPYVFLETVHSPASYSREQLDVAMTLAGVLGRGKLLLLERPERLRDEA